MNRKKILVVGEKSYIGEAFTGWLDKWPDQYQSNTISSIDNRWKEEDFSKYDVIFHVAGIAHVSTDKNLEDLYYKVNTELTLDVAKKAKEEGVKQFIFMSSIILYGSSGRVGEKKVITKDTIPQPADFYGNSKLKADQGLQAMQTDYFKVVSIRPPMIYGKNSKGNYPKLAKLARTSPIFPRIENERSMLHIDNLCEFIRLLIEYEESGIVYPQNKEYVNTTNLVQKIAKVYGKNIYTTRIFNPLVKLFSRKIDMVNKVFGNLVYDKSMSNYWNWEYCVYELDETIEKTEGNK